MQHRKLFTDTLFRLLAALSFALASACSSDHGLSVDDKPGCIVEVVDRLLACEGARPCEVDITRYATYCYNVAPGDQMDICRGGDYFFEQPLKEFAETHPQVNTMSKRVREIVIQTGQAYCQGNYN